MPPEPVTLQLWRDGRRIGPPLGAHVDWRERAALRPYLVDAVKRARYQSARLGEFVLEVRHADNRRHLTDFVATYDERRDR